MDVLDLRRPAEVTREFRVRLSTALAEHGFAARRQQAEFVRRRGLTTERIQLSSSHYNTPGDVACSVHFFLEDKAVAKRSPRWRAGGGFENPGFKCAEETNWNIADPANAKSIIQLILTSLSFFDLAGQPTQLLHEACRRYLPGFAEPNVVVPYLVERLGTDAVRTYANSLLAGRPELWPAFLLFRHIQPPAGNYAGPHGAQLAEMLALHAPDIAIDPPPDAIRAFGGLHEFFGLQLRAWGEPEAAGLLRRVGEERIDEHYKLHKEGHMLSEDPVVAAVRTFQLATGETRSLRRTEPKPRLFQYVLLHEPFSP